MRRHTRAQRADTLHHVPSGRGHLCDEENKAFHIQLGVILKNVWISMLIKSEALSKAQTTGFYLLVCDTAGNCV